MIIILSVFSIKISFINSSENLVFTISSEKGVTYLHHNDNIIYKSNNATKVFDYAIGHDFSHLRIEIMNGSYSFSSYSLIKSNLEIIGQGNTTILECSKLTNIFYGDDIENFTLANICLKGNRHLFPPTEGGEHHLHCGVLIDDGLNINITKVYGLGWHNPCIHIDAPINCSITNSVFFDNGIWASIHLGSSHENPQNGALNVTIKNNRFSNMKIGICIGWFSDKVNVSDCDFYNINVGIEILDGKNHNLNSLKFNNGWTAISTYTRLEIIDVIIKDVEINGFTYGINIGIKNKNYKISVKIRNSIFLNNIYGIYGNQMDLFSFVENQLYKNEYGIYIKNSSNGQIIANDFTDNQMDIYQENIINVTISPIFPKEFICSIDKTIIIKAYSEEEAIKLFLMSITPLDIVCDKIEK